MRNYRKEKNEKYTNKGITLIALTITIVIVLILAGVAISVLRGDEGVVSKTSSIVNVQEYNSEKEILDQDLINVRNKNMGKVSLDELEDEFSNNNLINDNEGTKRIDLNGDCRYDTIEIKTKKDNKFYYDGENIIGVDMFEEKYGKINFDTPYTIEFEEGTEIIYEIPEVFPGEIKEFTSIEGLPQVGDKKRTTDGKSYLFVGWRIKNGSDKLYTKSYSQISTNDVTLVAQWVENYCTVIAKVWVENIKNEEYELSPIEISFAISNKIDSISEYLFSDYGRSRIDEVISSDEFEEYDLDINKVTLKKGNIEITEEDIEKNERKDIEIEINRKRYTLDVIPGNYIKKVSVNEENKTTGSYKAGEEITIVAEKEEREGHTFNVIEWTTKDGKIIQIINNKYVMNKGNITLYANAKYTPNNYIVAYNGNGATEGKMTNSEHTYDKTKTLTANAFKRKYTVTYNHNYEGSTNTTKEAEYKFLGWAESSKGEVKYTDKQEVRNLATSGTITLYAKWTGTSVENFIPTRTGYTFEGWFTAPTGGTKISSSTVVPVEDTTYYAQWTPNIYTIKYNANATTGVSGSTADSTHVYDVAKELTSNGYKRTGYTFDGWNTKADGSGTNYNDKSLVSNLAASGTITLYANWTINEYKVTYDYATNGGTSATKTSENVKYNNSIDLTSSATKENWTFVGWNTDKNATKGIDSLKMEINDVTLYAIYSKTLSATLYKYNNEKIIKTVTIYNTQTNGDIVLPSIENVTVGSVTYIPRGWSIQDTANSQTLIEGNSKVTLSKDNTYYASYESNIKATFNYSTLAKEEYIYINATQATAEATATRYMNYKGTFIETEYTIPEVLITSTGGASAENYIGVSNNVSSVTTVTPTTANTAYYAVYTENLTFYYYDGSSNTSKKMIRRMLSNGNSYSNSLSELEPEPSSYQGANFAAWTYDSNNHDSSVRRTALSTGTNSLYAIYQVPINVTYNANGGEYALTTSSGTKYYISQNSGIKVFNPSIMIASTSPVRGGYDFTGWNTKADGSGTKYTLGEIYTFEENITLYAQWIVYTFSKEFNYTGAVQQLKIEKTGIYKLEVYGAQGGKSLANNVKQNTGGNGGYSSGERYFEEGTIIYIYVGGMGAEPVKGSNAAGGWNGGGYGTWDNSDDEVSGGGGGATDIRLTNGNWNDSTSLASRIIVAGGGGRWEF